MDPPEPERLGNDYAVCLRKTDGSPVVRLGEGWPADLSPDGKSVLAVVQSQPPRLVIYPTGAGETRTLERGELEGYASAQWFRDGSRVLVGGNAPGKGARLYVQEASGGAPRPVTPEDTRDGWIAPDGRLVLARGSAAGYALYPMDGGEPRRGSRRRTASRTGARTDARCSLIAAPRSRAASSAPCSLPASARSSRR